MSAWISDGDEGTVPEGDSTPRRKPAARGNTRFRRRRPGAPYQLHVLGSSVAELVELAGGWIFDRAMQGWRVHVCGAGDRDIRPLQILGVEKVPDDGDFKSVKAALPTKALALTADLYISNAHVRETALAALNEGLMELTLWGDTHQIEMEHQVENMTHRLSAAARAFKGHSLTAAAVPNDSVNMTESFRAVLAGVSHVASG